jgi:hypothetical protein
VHVEKGIRMTGFDDRAVTVELIRAIRDQVKEQADALRREE